MSKELSVVIPAYNEKNAIVGTIEQVVDIMDKTDIKFEVVVVNDGSKDGTFEILTDFYNKNKIIQEKVQIVSHVKNKGYGASLKTGIKKAKYANICITDSDATYPNNRIPDLYKEYESGYDMVVGKRSFKKLPTLTKPAKWFISKLANFLAGEKIPDINSGLRIFAKDTAKKFFPIICDGFSFTTTITLAMFTNDYMVKYIDIEYMKREGKSKIKPIRDTLNFIQLIVRTVMYFNPLKIFVPLSFLLFLVGLSLFILPRIGIMNTYHNDTISILLVGAVQVFATGLIADLIDKRVQK